MRNARGNAVVLVRQNARKGSRGRGCDKAEIQSSVVRIQMPRNERERESEILVKKEEQS